jgi:hypothetical protein
MPLPTYEEFKAQLVMSGTALDQIVQNHVFTGDVFAFQSSPRAYDVLRQTLARNLGVPSNDVAVVGSGKLGYSQHPERFPSPFNVRSDIDVIIVHSQRFDELWHHLLRWSYPRAHNRLPDHLFRWRCDRRDEIYTGYLQPGAISVPRSDSKLVKIIRGISMHWFNTLQSLSLHQEFANRDVKARLYRTWEHAMHYHVDGLYQLRARLSSAGVGP